MNHILLTQDLGGLKHPSLAPNNLGQPRDFEFDFALLAQSSYLT